jgi:hypothetical protein
MRHEGPGAAGNVAVEATGTAAVHKPILMAQAGGAPSAPQLLPLPAAEQITRIQPLPLGGGIEASAYALPNGVAFDRIRVVEVDGRLVLALVQPDGSVIVLEGTGPVSGSTTEFEIPNLIVGDVEVPRDALQAAFLDNGIVPAAGEPASPSSGFNSDEPFPGIGDGLGVTPLLPPTELAFDAFEPRELGDAFGNRNGLLGLDVGIDGGFGFPGDDDGDGGILPPSFVSGVIGSGGGGDGGTGDGDGEGGEPGSPGSGGNQGNGFMRLDQSAIAGGNQVNAGGVATLTNQVVILAGSNEARLVFGSLTSLVTDTNGTGPNDLIWRNDPDQPETRILGYVDRNGDTVAQESELAVVISLAGIPARPEQTSTYTVTVTLLQGLPDPRPGPGEGGSDTDGFDVGNIPLVIVDGRYTVLGEIDVVVLDDIPLLGEGVSGPNIVDEDALAGGNADSGATGENDRPDPTVTVSGSLEGLVRVGSDVVTPGSSEPLFAFRPFEGPGPHVLAGVTSKGDAILLSQSGGTLTGYVEGNASGGYQPGGAGAQDRAVFTLTLTPAGAYTFTLLDQVDHATLDGLPGDDTENASPLVIDLSGYVTAQDSDFDAVTLRAGMLAFQVLDDIPVAVSASSMVFTSIFEDSSFVNVLQIRGNDGATVSVNETPGSTATVLLNGDNAGSGNFRLDTGHDSSLARVQLWVDNGDGVFDRTTDTLVGTNEPVSALTWNDLASASFNGTRDLFLAFDDDGAGLDSDFNDIIVRVDTDGLSTPVLSVQVEEDGMSGPAGQPGFPDGSTGNKGPGDDVTQDEASGGAGSLFALFRVGADDDLTIGMASVLPAGLPRLLSKGEEVSYVLSGNTVTAVAGAEGAQRQVFTLAVNPNGSWAFDLKDQLDHAPADGENTLLRTVGGGMVAGIDLSRLITGTDEDGDTVSAAGGAFVIRVQDDVPVALPASGIGAALFTSIFEESSFFNRLEIEGSAGSAGIVDETPGDTAFVTFDATDTTTGKFALDTGHDGPAPGVQIWIDNGDGLFDRTSDTLSGPAVPVSALTWERLALASDTGAKDLFLALDDGGAAVDADFNDMIVRVQSLPRIVVEEDGMSGPAGQAGFADGSAGNKGPGDDNGQDEATGGPGSLTALFRSGSDEDLTIGLRAVSPDAGLPRVLSRGDEVSYIVAGNTVTGVAAGREVFTLTVQPDGSWAFDLRDQLDHVEGAGENTMLRTVGGGRVAGIDLSGLITATDHDGDSVTALSGAFVIGVQDDVPVFTAASAIVLPNEDGSEALGAFAFSVGADEPGTTRFADEAGSTALRVDGSEVLYRTSADGQSVTGYVDLDGNASISEAEQVFEARLLGGGSYGVQMFKAVDSGAVDPAGLTNQGLAFRIEHTDSDGDVATGSLSVTLADDPIVTGTAGDDASLVGSAQNDVIDGLAGNDWLYGEDGDDILIGNLGADTLVGGPGADTFKLTDLSAQDLIADYGTGTDRIDLTALFSTGTDGPASPTELLEYVRYDDGALTVDADGAGDAHGFVQVAFVDTAGPGVAPPPSIQIVYDDQSHQVQTANLTG